jgi:Insertion element 4 transposase N-terminal/Transposase DDE domain
VPFYRCDDDTAMDEAAAGVFTPVQQPAAQDPPVVGPPVGMVAVRVADLVASGRGEPGGAVVAAGAAAVSGEAMVFCAAVVTTAAVLRRDGRVQAGGWLPEQVRLGVLDQHLGEGVIERLVTDPALGAQPELRRRLMSLPLTARFVLAMTLLPEASYPEVMARLVGVLPQVPWRQAWQVPGAKVLTGWRRRLGPKVMRALFHEVAGVIDPTPDWRDLLVCAVDGFHTRVPDTPANRRAFGSVGTADDSAGFPSVRTVIATTAQGRATLAAVPGAADVGEQTLLLRMVKQHPEVFCAGRVFCLDRNFPGYKIIDRIRACGGHLVMRMKAGISLELVRWLPDGSYLAWLGKTHRRLVRVVEYDVDTADGVSELFCLATTLLDWQTYPAAQIAAIYPKRWVASETTIGENKTLVTDAGPSRGPILRSTEPALVIQELYAWLTAGQLLRRTAHATAAAATHRPVTADEVSFTATRHEATRSMTQTLITATTSPQALAAATQQASQAILSRLLTPARDRHSDRTRKHHPRFSRSKKTTPTTRGKATVNLSQSPVHSP